MYVIILRRFASRTEQHWGQTVLSRSVYTISGGWYSGRNRLAHSRPSLLFALRWHVPNYSFQLFFLILSCAARDPAHGVTQLIQVLLYPIRAEIYYIGLTAFSFTAFSASSGEISVPCAST